MEGGGNRNTLERTGFDDRGLGELCEHYLELVQNILLAASHGGSWNLHAVAKGIVEFAANAVKADVSYIRRIVGHESLELLGGQAIVHWRLEQCDRWGEVPSSKLLKDCFNGGDITQFSLATLPKTSFHFRDYEKEPEGGAYSGREQDYFKFLKGVAIARLGAPEVGPPRFLLFLGYRNTEVLSAGSVARKRFDYIQPLLDSAFRLSEGVQDRFDKAQRLKNLTDALPLLALAPTGEAFWRGVVTILTSKPGFGFHRAMVFLWRSGNDVATCRMAVGGTGGDWPRRQQEITSAFNDGATLRDYVQESLANPIPGSGKCSFDDPLYESVCGNDPLVFDLQIDPTPGSISHWLKNIENEPKPGLEAQPGQEFSSADDPWIAKVANDRQGVFFTPCGERWPKDQYYGFPLVALDARGERRKIGFVLADVSYAAGGHVPGIDMPDLEITSTVLHLVAGMWRARGDEEEYTHTLEAMSALRHHGGSVAKYQDELCRALPPDVRDEPTIATFLKDLLRAGAELGKAKQIIEGNQYKLLNSAAPPNPSDLTRECGEIASRVYPHLNFSLVSDPEPLKDIPTEPWNGESVRIPGESLKQIVDCILDNAAEFATITVDGSGTATVRAAVRLVNVRVEGQSDPRKRVLITLENDGKPIARDHAPFIFADGVSTRPTLGHGTGLSTARQIAKAYHGDVILLQSDAPVLFGIVLPIAAVASSYSI